MLRQRSHEWESKSRRSNTSWRSQLALRIETLAHQSRYHQARRCSPHRHGRTSVQPIGRVVACVHPSELPAWNGARRSHATVNSTTGTSAHASSQRPQNACSPVFPERFVAPDWMVRGDSFAQDTRWPAVGNLPISRPISARITCAPPGPIPGTSSRRCSAGTTVASGARCRRTGRCCHQRPRRGRRASRRSASRCGQ